MSQDSAGLVVGSEPGAAAKRSRVGKWIIATSLIIVTLLALAALAELALRLVIPNVVAANVREQLHLSPEHPVDVTLEGSALLPALTGHVGPAQLRVNDVVVLDGVKADLRASAQSVPFNPTRGEIEDAHVSVTVPSSSVGALVSLATEGLANSGEIRDGQLFVGRTLELFGAEVTLTASLGLSIEHGDLVIEPTGVNAAGFDLTAEQLRPLLGAEAATILDAHTICVRDQLPEGVSLSSVELSRSALGQTFATVSARLDPDILSNPAKQDPGVCE